MPGAGLLEADCLVGGLLGSLAQGCQILLFGVEFGDVNFAVGGFFNLLSQVLILQSQDIPFSHQPIDNLILLLHLYDRFILDIHGPGGVVERAEGLIEVGRGGTGAGHHQSLGSAAKSQPVVPQRIHQQHRQFRIAVGM